MLLRQRLLQRLHIRLQLRVVSLQRDGGIVQLLRQIVIFLHLLPACICNLTRCYQFLACIFHDHLILESLEGMLRVMRVAKHSIIEWLLVAWPERWVTILQWITVVLRDDRMAPCWPVAFQHFSTEAKNHLDPVWRGQCVRRLIVVPSFRYPAYGGRLHNLLSEPDLATSQDIYPACIRLVHKLIDIRVMC